TAVVNQVTDTLTWTFKVKDGAIDHLAAGETVVQKYTITLKNYSGNITTAVVTITLRATNDAPEITSGVQSGSVAELPDGHPGENKPGHREPRAITLVDVDFPYTQTSTVAPLGPHCLASLMLGSVNLATDPIGWRWPVP